MAAWPLHEAYYDTALNITWLANANAAVGSAYDTYNPGTGMMTWANANAWAANLNINGITGWWMPTVSPIDGATANDATLGLCRNNTAIYQYMTET